MRILSAAAMIFSSTIPTIAWADDLVVGLTAWPSAQVTGHIIGLVAAEKFGVEVSYVERGSFGLLSDMARGEIDVYPELWSPNLDNALARHASAILVSPKKVAARQGMCVTKATADQTGIASVSDLAKPEMAAFFDTDDDGKGEVWVGDGSWFSTGIERIRAKSLGYDQTMTLLEGPEEVAMAAVDVAAATGRPIVLYCYSPHHMFELHDVVFLDEAPYDPARWHIVAPADDPNWLTASRAETGWDASSLSIAYAASLAERQPAVAGFLSSIQFDPQDIAAMSYAVEVERKSPADAATDWMANNTERFEGWLQ